MIGKIIAAVIGYGATAVLIAAAGVGVWRILADRLPERMTADKVKGTIIVCLVFAAIIALMTACATGI